MSSRQAKTSYRNAVVYHLPGESTLHRLDGPAIVWLDESDWDNSCFHSLIQVNGSDKKTFYLYGVVYEEKEFWSIVNSHTPEEIELLVKGLEV